MHSFEIYGKWSVQANMHTHVCNEVTLVRGSLRLAPIIHNLDKKMAYKLFQDRGLGPFFRNSTPEASSAETSAPFQSINATHCMAI